MQVVEVVVDDYDEVDEWYDECELYVVVGVI